jgi:hypothetical protein
MFRLEESLPNLRQELRHFSVGSAVISVRVLCPISINLFKSLRSGWYDTTVPKKIDKEGSHATSIYGVTTCFGGSRFG